MTKSRRTLLQLGILPAQQQQNPRVFCNSRQRHYGASGSKEHVSMERGACERRALNRIKIENPYSQICFTNFVEEKEEKSQIWTYYRVPYNRGLYGNLFVLGKKK